MITVLFVCSANRFRSVIAREQFQQLLRSYPTSGDWQAQSAGTWADPGLLPLPQAVKFCRKLGWSIDNVRSQEVNAELLENARLVLTMTQGQYEAIRFEFPQAKRKTFLLSEVCDKQKYDVSDPFENPEMNWEEVGSEVCELVSKGFYSICRLALNDYGKA